MSLLHMSKECNYGPETLCSFLIIDGYPDHLLLDWCFFSLPGQARSEGQKLPFHNVKFWVFRQQVIALRDFLEMAVSLFILNVQECISSESRANIHCTQSPAFTFFKNFRESILVQQSHKIPRVSAHKNLHFQFIPNVHRYISFTT
jgi:hypothetical protein